ncbi:DUF488 domain-containing protein [Spirulina subsalsa FACHB-351]|uniref:DUF488 domain-containing protein n=1 Tax=Spirulina subsalsa FACHB-351 TaxID=234711 RepID=A0ABT3L515_9CYAN|nr:DUF488 domain-containing protein [Spirulina subsalsa]MCW6036570.1 DUF488 domain-containing protein [Spirulina subsalsa FACHB-351]
METLYTLGHSNHSLETLIGLLQHHQIQAVADVRSHPYSRYLPHFNQNELKTALKSHHLHYVFLGQELGARPKDLSCYNNGKALYQRIAQTELFQQGLQRLQTGLQTYRISLLCAEKDPITCHRTILVCRQMKQLTPHLNIEHILANGELESHLDLENRLLQTQGFTSLFPPPNQPQQLSLFDTMQAPPDREQCLQEAYEKQGDKIAYIDPELA